MTQIIIYWHNTIKLVIHWFYTLCITICIILNYYWKFVVFAINKTFIRHTKSTGQVYSKNSKIFLVGPLTEFQSLAKFLVQCQSFHIFGTRKSIFEKLNFYFFFEWPILFHFDIWNVFLFSRKSSVKLYELHVCR